MDIYKYNINKNPLIPNPNNDNTIEDIFFKSYPYPCFISVAPCSLSLPIINYNNINVDKQLYHSIPIIPNKPLYYQNIGNPLYSQVQSINIPNIQNKPLYSKNTEYPLHNLSQSIDKDLYNKTLYINNQKQGIVQVLCNQI